MARWAGPGVKVFREGDGAACREGHRGGGSGRVGVEWYVASGGALQAYRSPRQGLRWGTAELGGYRRRALASGGTPRPAHRGLGI